jgi:adenylate cyclase
MRMGWLFADRPRAPVLVALLVLLNALMLRVADPGELVRLRDIAFDGYQRLKPRVLDAGLPVHVVDIDEPALAEYGQWPWPRHLLGTLVDKLAEKGVAAIAFDVVFAERDRSSFRAIARALPEAVQSSDLRRMLDSLPDNDEQFAEAIGSAPVVLGFAFDAAGAGPPPRRLWGVAHNSAEIDEKLVPQMIQQFIPQQGGAVRTISILQAMAKGNGAVTTEVEGAIVRHIPLLYRLAKQRDEDLYPALSIEAVRVAQGASTYLVRWAGAQGLESFGARTGISSIRVGQLNIDTDAQGRFALYDSGHRPERFISASDVLKGTVPAEKLEGSIVFVGTSAVGLKDLRNTPTQDSVPGVEIHVQIVEQILTQTFLERPDYADGAEFLYLMAIGLLFVLLIPRLSAARMAIVAALFIGIGIAVPWFAFAGIPDPASLLSPNIRYVHLLFDPIYPPATLAAIYVSGSALGFIRAERDRREIRGAFGMYLSPDVVEQVARNPKLLQLGGELREITVMFTDVRGFTRISEQFDPQGLTRFMNRFLTPMTELIQSHRGTIDKYMGDAIMAFWNAPLPVEAHAGHACAAALEMQARLRILNGEWKAEAEAEGRTHIPVNIGIGLNTGQAAVGNFGSTQRLTYSCLGDEVNLAARLEGQCKTYGVGVIVGDNTCQQVPTFAMLELDLVMVKGKTEPERVFALVGGKGVGESAAFQTLVDRQAGLLLLYRAGSFVEALELIPECVAAAEAVGWHQSYYDMMRERIDALIDDSPLDWNGVYVAKEK